MRSGQRRLPLLGVSIVPSTFVRVRAPVIGKHASLAPPLQVEPSEKDLTSKKPRKSLRATRRYMHASAFTGADMVNSSECAAAIAETLVLFLPRGARGWRVRTVALRDYYFYVVRRARLLLRIRAAVTLYLLIRQTINIPMETSEARWRVFVDPVDRATAVTYTTPPLFF